MLAICTSGFRFKSEKQTPKSIIDSPKFPALFAGEHAFKIKSYFVKFLNLESAGRLDVDPVKATLSERQ